MKFTKNIEQKIIFPQNSCDISIISMNIENNILKVYLQRMQTPTYIFQMGGRASLYQTRFLTYVQEVL